MDRLEAFNSYRDHAWYGKLYKRLSKTELAVATGFITENSGISRDLFQFKVNRLFLDKPKSKNWSALVELLTCTNSK